METIKEALLEMYPYLKDNMDIDWVKELIILSDLEEWMQEVF